VFIGDILGRIGDAGSVGALCECLQDDNLNVACSAAEALGRIGAPEAVPDLLAICRKVEEVRLPALEAIGRIGDSSALPDVAEYIGADNPVVGYAAVEAMGLLGGADSIPRLVGLLDDANQSIAQAALSAIVAICSRNGETFAFDLPLAQFTDFLFERISSGDRIMTAFTLDRLAERPSPDGWRRLLDVIDVLSESDRGRACALIHEAGPTVWAIAMERFPDLSTPAKLICLDILTPYLDETAAVNLGAYAQDPDAKVRQQVAQALGQSGCEDVVPVLRRMALDEIGHVRAAAYGALGWLSAEQEVDFLFNGLGDPYPDVREAAVGALIVIGGPHVVAKFTADLYHHDAERQRLAVTALGMIGEPDVIEPLLKVINHSEATVRRSAIETLGRLGEVPDIEPLVAALNDEDPGVRKAAVSTLLELRGQGAVPEVRVLLDDADIWVRYHAITAIGELQNHDNGPLIVPYLTAGEDILRIATTRALARMNYREAAAAIEVCTHDKNTDLAKAATGALAELGGEK